MRGTFGLFFRLAGIVAVLLCLSPMVGCGSDDDIPAGLLTVWQLQELRLDNGTVTAVDDPSGYTLELKADGNADIRSDCNSCGGSYTVDGSDLSFGPLACTFAECGPASFATQFQAALTTTTSYEIEGGLLFLNYEGGEMRLTPQPTLQ